jgi:hypothetical protein
MYTHIDIAQRILETVLNTGIAPQTHGRHVGQWAQEQPIAHAFGCAITDAVALVASRINPTLVEWFDDMLFSAACEAPGEIGRRFDAARVAVIPGMRRAARSMGGE